MALNSLAWPALAVLFSIITFLTLSKTGKDVVLRRLGLSRRSPPARPSTPNVEKQTPAASSSSSSSSSSKPIAATRSELASTFPPPLREQLRKLRETLPASQQAALGDLAFDQKEFERSLLGFEEDYRTADDGKYVYTGFSVREVRALGDFPDYAALCEVPLPRPYEGFDIDRALPRPYRPLRWAYHQTMSLTKLETDWWIELESTYRARIAQRQALYAEHGPAVLQWLPGSELACKELMEMVVQFVCARYPRCFALSPDRSRLENRILGTTTVLAERPPLLVLLDNVPEDFGVVLRHPATGLYHFRAGVICSALGWNVASKIGLQLHEIHEKIPDYKEKMQFSMDRYFSKLPSSKPIQRGSWGLEVDQPLYMPPGDPHERLRASQDPGLAPERCHFRVDWQTLRRLPLSGGVVFNFKGLFTPVASFRDEPYVPALLLKVLTDGSRDIMRYKGTWHTEHVVLPMLREFAREQEEDGVVERGWEPRTLDESPWFPGWEGKWRAQQGF